MLLILEVSGLVFLGGYEFLQVDWRGINLQSPQHQAVEVAVFALFIPSAVLTLLSALSFLFLQRRGWLLAAIAQGMSLAVCLWLYLVPAGLRLPDHGLLRTDDPLPQLPGRADGVPPRTGPSGVA